jgi:hypothetical protein
MQAFYPPHSGYHRPKYFWGENSNYKRFILGNIQTDEFLKLPIFSYEDGGRAANVPHGLTVMIAYFSPSWTAFQADRGRDFSVIVDGISN